MRLSKEAMPPMKLHAVRIGCACALSAWLGCGARPAVDEPSPEVSLAGKTIERIEIGGSPSLCPGVAWGDGAVALLQLQVVLADGTRLVDGRGASDADHARYEAARREGRLLRMKELELELSGPVTTDPLSDRFLRAEASPRTLLEQPISVTVAPPGGSPSATRRLAVRFDCKYQVVANGADGAAGAYGADTEEQGGTGGPGGDGGTGSALQVFATPVPDLTGWMEVVVKDQVANTERQFLLAPKGQIELFVRGGSGGPGGQGGRGGPGFAGGDGGRGGNGGAGGTIAAVLDPSLRDTNALLLITAGGSGGEGGPGNVPGAPGAAGAPGKFSVTARRMGLLFPVSADEVARATAIDAAAPARSARTDRSARPAPRTPGDADRAAASEPAPAGQASPLERLADASLEVTPLRMVDRAGRTLAEVRADGALRIGGKPFGTIRRGTVVVGGTVSYALAASGVLYQRRGTSPLRLGVASADGAFVRDGLGAIKIGRDRAVWLERNGKTSRTNARFVALPRSARRLAAVVAFLASARLTASD